MNSDNQTAAQAQFPWISALGIIALSLLGAFIEVASAGDADWHVRHTGGILDWAFVCIAIALIDLLNPELKETGTAKTLWYIAIGVSLWRVANHTIILLR